MCGGVEVGGWGGVQLFDPGLEVHGISAALYIADIAQRDVTASLDSLPNFADVSHVTGLGPSMLCTTHCVVYVIIGPTLLYITCIGLWFMPQLQH